MSDVNDYDDDEREDPSVDENEAKAAQKGGSSEEEAGMLSDLELAEAESLTVTAKQHIREQLEDEVARFLAQGGKITQVPAGEANLD